MLSLNYEYRVVPAPRRAAKVKTARSSEERFAQSLCTLMNDLGREGWEYVRSDTLPMDERAGLTSTKTSYFNMLVFRRVIVRNTATFTDKGADVDGSDLGPNDAFFPAPKPLRSLPSVFGQRPGNPPANPAAPNPSSLAAE